MNMDITPDIIELVVARLQNLPSDKEISIGSTGAFSKDELIDHVKKSDEIGRKMITIELEFLRSLKDGILYEHSPRQRA
jgi:hypothetical protein